MNTQGKLRKLINTVLLSFLFVCCKGQVQNSQTKINPQAINYTLLENEFMARFNALRVSLQLKPLTKDKILGKAAQDQALYQNEKHFVGHVQNIKNKESPQKRVFFYGGTHNNIGENCISRHLGLTYAEVADALFNGWKNSPGHYRNMIDSTYELCGLGFSFDQATSTLYSTQVFAQVPYLFEGDMLSPPDAYGVKEAPDKFCDQFNTPQAKKALSSFGIMYQNDTLFLRCEEKELFTKFFNKAGDAIYFDVVLRNQFGCEKFNRLHGSPVHDGKMFAPILFSDIVKRNRLKGTKNMFAPICPVPKQYSKNKANLNYGFVRNNISCEYTYPIHVPSKNLEMLDLFPKFLYQPDVPVEPDTFSGKLSFTIPFERGEVKPSQKTRSILDEKLAIYKKFIRGAKLQTFSSIEGNSKSNLILQQQRATSILEILKDYYPDSLGIQTQGAENWDTFFQNIENTMFAHLKNRSKEQIKEKLKSKALLDSLDFILRLSRTAELTLDIKAPINNDSSPYLLLAAYKKSVENRDSAKAFILQNKLIEAGANLKFDTRDLLQIELPVTRQFLPHITNYLAIYITSKDWQYYTYVRNLVLEATKIDTNYLPIKFNLCHMGLKNMHYYADTLVKPSKLETKMDECYKLGTYEDSVLINHMWLNYSILSAYNNWELRQFDNINKHLNKVVKYYPGAQISEYEAVQLGLLFNEYARYDWTCTLLAPYLKKKQINNDILFLFVQSYSSLTCNSVNEETWEKYLLKAQKSDPARFFNWIDKESFQLLRIPIIKKRFCEISQ